MSVAFVFPRSGIAVGRHDDAASNRSRQCDATFDEAALRSAWTLWALVQRRTRAGAQQDGQHAAGDARSGSGAVPRVAGELGGADPRCGGWPQPGRVLRPVVAAGVLEFAEAVPLVRFRAQAMQEAGPRGQRRDRGASSDWTRRSASVRCACEAGQMPE